MELRSPARSVVTFLSAPSVGRATKGCLSSAAHRKISIRALRGEGDFFNLCIDYKTLNFYPRPPWGGRRPKNTKIGIPRTISIRALRGEGDTYIYPQYTTINISIRALRGEGDFQVIRIVFGI